MSFGRRTTAPAGVGASRPVAEAPRTRRGGYWLGLLANAAVAILTMAVMPFISQFKLNGSRIETLIAVGGIAILNVVAVAAVITLLVDFALRGLGWRKPWVYALVCAAVVFAFYLAMTLAGGSINPIFALYVAVWPAAVGGWVMGLYRR
ncbi:hypothetical protein [Brevundimonas sp.]|uniref:hypothetical protein n=1 Tax=Brevundimonas sp. TaxID=1871086 RepID=UPI0025C614C7|nr:hypothetical protein [Brevundimonas sp.]